MPQLVLSAKPKVGVRTVNITRIADFIEHKIQMELQVQTLRIKTIGVWVRIVCHYVMRVTHCVCVCLSRC